MEFESPDVEKDFPGLYASESGKRSQESDFSDDAHDRPSKKDLLIGKRKDKKESKKDQGYAALEGESSPEEDLDMKSPSKSKKSKSFKFPTIKEKREKSQEKDVREREREKEHEADKEKEKKKEKGKLKLKERKKSKHGDDEPDIGEALPIFGVPLTVAVERSSCHDGVALPLVVRNCIDFVQDSGLRVVGIYKLSGIKSKVQQLKRMYNQREAVQLWDFDMLTVTSLLKTFLRELPEPLLTSELLPRFEEASSLDLAPRQQEFAALVSALPLANRTALRWIMIHLDSVMLNEKHNKMGSNALAVTLGPILQFSHRLFRALLLHTLSLFPDVHLPRYVPPLSAGSSVLPDTAADITLELQKQESLLSQIHSEMNLGYCSTRRTEQLWEVQRLVTQLKRKLKSLERSQESSHLPAEETPSTSQVSQTQENALVTQTTVQPAAQAAASSDGTTNSGGSNGSEAEETLVQDEADLGTEDARNSGSSCGSANLPIDPVKITNDMSAEPDFAAGAGQLAEGQVQRIADQTETAELTQLELQKLQSNLLERIRRERAAVEKLRAALANLVRPNHIHSNTDNVDCMPEEMESELRKHNIFLQQNKRALLQKIIDEREACVQLKAKCNKFSSDKKSEANDCKGLLKLRNNSVIDTAT